MNRLWAFWPSLVAAALLLVVSGVLLGSLSYRFFVGELPCPGVIAFATFAMEGFHFLLPDNPDRYELLRQLRIVA